jgi:hypothetical protein
MGKCCGVETEARGARNAQRQQALAEKGKVGRTGKQDRNAVADVVRNRVDARADTSDEGSVDDQDRVVAQAVPDEDPLDPRFTPATLQFRSTDGADLPKGGLYFANGCRIRLVHASGPAIEQAPNQRRYCIDDVGAEKYDGLNEDVFDQKDLVEALNAELEDLRLRDSLSDKDLDRIEQLEANIPEEQERFSEMFAELMSMEQTLAEHLSEAKPGSDGCLLEFGNDVCHISRGRPVLAPNLDQRQLNAIVTAARTGENQAMAKCFASF